MGLPDTRVTGTAFAEYLELIGRIKPNDARVQEVESLRHQAIAYVWGWQDAGGVKITADDSWLFGLAYGTHCARYALEEIGMQSNIRDAFAAWRDGRTF